MSYKIEDVEGIGPAYRRRLAAAKIRTTGDLLKKCCDARGRETTSSAVGVTEHQLLKWANLADLMRIKGVGSQYSELLEAAGVDTVKELRHRNAANLTVKLKEVNEAKRLTRAVPSEKAVARWVRQAAALKPAITH